MPPYLCYGIRSRLPCGMHAIFCDFDDIPSARITRGIKKIFKESQHSDYLILKNTTKKNHFHAICPTKVTTFEYLDILKFFIDHGLDENFTYPLNKWNPPTTILRFHSPDKGGIELVKVIKSPHQNIRKMSLAHLIFLKNVFGADIKGYSNIDDNRGFTIDRYLTAKQ